MARTLRENIRITSGKLRGRAVVTPGGKTHPMGDRERLALFNMLTGEIENAVVLDAFAGSGALGIEALSRGAERAVFVEKNHVAAKVILENLQNLGIRAGYEVIRHGVENYETDERFDIILADPPYDDFRPEIIEHLLDFLKEGGMLALSHPGEAPVLEGVVLTKTHRYAAARLSLYRMAENKRISFTGTD